MKNNQPILIGLLGGITAGLMMFAALRSGVGALVLMFMAPAAIYLASMGWGSLSGLIAVVVATAICFSIGGYELALISTLMIFVPAGWVGHLTNLADVGESEEQTFWFPLGNILLQLAVLIGAGVVISSLILGFSEEVFIEQFSKLMIEIDKSSGGELSLNPENIKQTAAVYAKTLPFVIPPTWLAMHVIVSTISARITAKSARLARPLDDIAASVSLPNIVFAALIAGLIVWMLFSGTLSQIGGVVVSLCLMSISLIGLADLHYRTRGNPARTPILIIAYLLIVLFYIPLIFFAFTGAARMLRMNGWTNSTN